MAAAAAVLTVTAALDRLSIPLILYHAFDNEHNNCCCHCTYNDCSHASPSFR